MIGNPREASLDVPWLARQIDRREAEQRLQSIGRWNRALRALTGRRTAFPDRALPSLEALWLPGFLVSAPIEPRSQQGVTRDSEESRAKLHCRVCALSGSAIRIDESVLRFFENTNQEAEESASGWRPGFRLTEQEAGGSGRTLLGALLLHSREAARYAVGGPLEVTPLRHPYWIYVWERRYGRLDLRLLDGLDGSKAPGDVRAAVLQALLTRAS